MKILFLVFHGFEPNSGITKKIQYQVRGLSQLGHEVHVCTYGFSESGHRVRWVDDEVIADYGTGKLAALRARFDLGVIARWCATNAIDMVYARSFHNASPLTIGLFRQLRSQGIRVAMEIPTYPYDQEYVGFPLATRTKLRIDRLFRRRLASQTDAIVTFSDEERIFGQRTIRISNGIDLEAIPIKNRQSGHSRPSPSRPTPLPLPCREGSSHRLTAEVSGQHLTVEQPTQPLDPQKVYTPLPTREGHGGGSGSSIHLTAVAEVHYWHGLDRVIDGLGHYYARPHSREVIFHIVGGVGPSEMHDSIHAPGFAELIAKWGIEDKVIFHGQLFGQALTDVFDITDLGIGSLARHRSGIQRIKTLKNREYAARGIPFIYSETDTDFDSQPYVMKVPADESPVDIASVIAFLDAQKLAPQDIRATVEHLSWKNQMDKVITELHRS